MSDDGWYWDLDRKVAVPAAERGPGDHTLGPYPTRAEAEDWRERNEARNETWDADDEKWNRWDADDEGDDG